MAQELPPVYLIPGLTRRGYFAAVALQKLIAPDEIYYTNGQPMPSVTPEARASLAVQYADALIAVLGNT